MRGPGKAQPLESDVGAEASTVLTARLAQRTARELTFEIPVDAAFDWEPTGVVVYWSDGIWVKADIDKRHSTASGHVERGTTLRLSVRLEKDGPDEVPTHLMMINDGAFLRIDVRRA